MNKTMNKSLYNAVLSQTFSPCGNYLLVGDIYGQIQVFHLVKIINPESSLTKQDRSPKNIFTVEANIQINALLTTDNHLIVGTVDNIMGYDWNSAKNSKAAKPQWKITLPSAKDNFQRGDVYCLVLNAESGLLYASCGDNKIYAIHIEIGSIIRTLNGHSHNVYSIFNIGNDLISGGEDGLVNIWDIREKQIVNKIEPHKYDKIARPEVGKWIGAVGMNGDLLLCGGGPRLSVWHFRSLDHSTVFPIEDRGIHVAEFFDDKVLAGGQASNFYTMYYNGTIVSEIPTSSVAVYSAIHQEEPYTALCIAGSNNKIDICSNFNYRDQILPIC